MISSGGQKHFFAPFKKGRGSFALLWTVPLVARMGTAHCGHFLVASLGAETTTLCKRNRVKIIFYQLYTGLIILIMYCSLPARQTVKLAGLSSFVPHLALFSFHTPVPISPPPVQPLCSHVQQTHPQIISFLSYLQFKAR